MLPDAKKLTDFLRLQSPQLCRILIDVPESLFLGNPPFVDEVEPTSEATRMEEELASRFHHMLVEALIG